MKRTVYPAGTLPTSLSPITPDGQLVYSRIKKFGDPHDRTKEYIEELTPNRQEAFKVLQFLDAMNGIGYTPELKRIEKELRAALLDLVGGESIRREV